MNKERIHTIQIAIEAQLRDYWQQRYDAYCAREKTDAQLWGDRAEPSELGENARAAYDFYKKKVSDWGLARVYQVEIEGEAVAIVDVGTDGDDGWLEAYDRSDHLIGAARRYIELLAWGDVSEMRSQTETLELPPELNPKQSLWKG